MPGAISFARTGLFKVNMSVREIISIHGKVVTLAVKETVSLLISLLGN
jgi:hypothetical protein